MAPAAPSLPLILSTLCLLSPLILAQTAAPAPAPAPSPTNITAILEKAGDCTTFIRMIKDTQTETQIINQLNSSQNSMTVIAPSDNAFNKLPAGTLNNLDTQKKVQLVQFHIMPQFYTIDDLKTVSNPVPTQAGDKAKYGLNFIGDQSQVNVSSGNLTTPINTVLSGVRPMAVYKVDTVMIPVAWTAKAETPAPAPKSSKTNSSSNAADSADAPSASGAGERGLGLGLVVGLVMVCIGAFSS